jgi:transcriptional regulator with XRE-family HTH domain
VEVNVEALKELRRRRVWTVEELAVRAGVSKNTVSKAENGGSVYPSSIRKLAKALEVEPAELVGAEAQGEH